MTSPTDYSALTRSLLASVVKIIRDAMSKSINGLFSNLRFVPHRFPPI